MNTIIYCLRKYNYTY